MLELPKHPEKERSGDQEISGVGSCTKRPNFRCQIVDQDLLV